MNQISSDEIKRYIRNKFGDYLYYYYEDENRTVESQFVEEFEMYAKMESNNLCFLFNAFILDYNPIENYDLKEEGYDGNKASELTAINDYSENYKTVTRQYEATMSAEAKETAWTETVPEGKYKSVSRTAEEKTTTFDGETTENFATLTKRALRRHGNIGIQSGADLITKELSLRFKTIIFLEIDHICNQILYLWGECE